MYVSGTKVLWYGDWIGPVLIPPSSSTETSDLADTLVSYLNSIHTGQSVIEASTSEDVGIHFGLYSEWCPELAFQGYYRTPAFIDRTDYLIVPLGDRVIILGKDATNLERAMYLFLKQMGVYQFAPTDNWEVIPTKTEFVLREGFAEDKPIRWTSGIGIAGGLLTAQTTRNNTWITKNSISQFGNYPIGHQYAAIVNANQATFNAHPEYISDSGNKFCVFEPALEQLCIDYAKNYVKNTFPDTNLFSMTAADGSLGWSDVCPGTNEESLYSPADRQVHLANVVQAALDADADCRGVRVSILAYAETAAKPTIQVNPRLVIVVTNGFFLSGRTYDQVVSDYREMGAVDLVPYSYFSVWTWNRGAPGNSRVSNFNKIVEDIQMAFDTGTDWNALTGEGSPTWGPDGMSYWIIGQMLSEKHSDLSSEALLTRLNYHRQVFLDTCFGQASSVMGSWYDLMRMDVSAPLFSEDLIHRMYSYLQQALQINLPQDVKNRIYDLVCYTRYADLLLAFNKTQDQDSFEEMLKWNFQIRNKDLVQFKYCYSDTLLAPWIDLLEVKYGYTIGWSTVTNNHPWPDTLPTESELDTIISNGLVSNALLPFTPIGFGPIQNADVASSIPNVTRTSFLYMLQDNSWYLKLKPGQTQFLFTASAGISSQIKGPSYITIVDAATDEILNITTVPEDRTTRSYSVDLPADHLYRVDFDVNGGIDCDWYDSNSPSIIHQMTRVTDSGPSPFISTHAFWFWVPVGTQTIGGYWNSVGARLIDVNGTVRLTNTTLGSYFNLTVPAGLDGKFWKMDRNVSKFFLLTVPAEVALSPAELLIPEDAI